MFVAIIGSTCAGKRSLHDYLVSKGFSSIRLVRNREPVESKQLALSQAPADSFYNSTNHLENAPTDQVQDASSSRTFGSHTEMLDFATRNWQSNFVTTSLQSLTALESFVKRPFVLLIHVDAPLLERWRRYQERARVANASVPQMTEFLEADDEHVYGSRSRVNSNSEIHLSEPLRTIVAKLPHLAVLNSSGDLPSFHNHLDALDISNPERLRPGWDSYFMTLSELASQRSNCMKRRVGAILVRHNRILSTGYNGTPRGLQNCNEGGCRRCNGHARSGEALNECLCLHAEENALLEAGRERVGNDAILYCNTCPCLRCSVKIVQIGVKEVVYNFAYSMDESSAKVFKEAGVRLRQHSPAN